MGSWSVGARTTNSPSERRPNRCGRSREPDDGRTNWRAPGKNCDPTDPADDHKGDWWDHVAFDPEHRLVLAVVPGARSMENAEEIVATAKDRTDGVSPRLITSDEYPAYASAVEAAFSVPVPG